MVKRESFRVNFSYFMMYYFIESDYILGANEDIINLKLQNSAGVFSQYFVNS